MIRYFVRIYFGNITLGKNIKIIKICFLCILIPFTGKNANSPLTIKGDSHSTNTGK